MRGALLKFSKQQPNAITDAFLTKWAQLYRGDALAFYEKWPAPTCIIADGPYGLGKFPGEPHSTDKLAEWYAPHVAAWSKFARPNATLWFWNSEIGWAKSHPVLELHGWEYEETVVWDKGIGHIAGNCNSKTIRGVPVVTEVAVRYSRRLKLVSNGKRLPIKAWIRSEWLRSGLPMNQANAACRVANAATRKYLTQCHLWYFPPGEAIERMALWCKERGRKTDVPYFSIDRVTNIDAQTWDSLRSKWNHSHGVTNVWQEPAVHGPERIKLAGASVVHANQKPLRLMEKQIVASTDPHDVIWEPFGGLCSASVASTLLSRSSYAAEVHDAFYLVAAKRLSDAAELAQKGLARA